MIRRSHRNLVCDTIDGIGSLSSLSQLGARLADAMGKFGFSSMGINGLPPPAEDADPLVLIESVPDGFRDFYIHERLYAANHIAVHARATYEPFRFSDAPYPSGESQRHKRFLRVLDSYHMGKGVIVPIGYTANIPACVWLAGDNPEMDDDAIVATQLISLFAASKANALSRRAVNDRLVISGLRQDVARRSLLTKREREVLQWISAGKTSWEIGVICGLSERAINSITAAAMTKLGAVTRVHAVVIAIRLGEVEL